MGTRGISVPAVSMAGIGAYLVWSAINNVPITQGARDIVHGQKPPTNASHGSTFLDSIGNSVASGVVTSDTVTSLGTSLANDIKKYIGVKYHWGGTSVATGFDCSGLIDQAFHDVGIRDIPRTSSQMAVWGKFHKESSPIPGDVLWWPGHVAMAVSSSQMVEAPTFGIPVRQVGIRSGYLVLRYVG